MSEQQIRQAIVRALQDMAGGGRPASDVALSGPARRLFETLGYHSEKRLDLTPNTPEQFIAAFDAGGRLAPDRSLLAEWTSVDFLFQLTDAELRAAGSGQLSFDSGRPVDQTIIQSYLFFAVDLRGVHYTRTQLAGATREINKLFPMPVMVLFRHGQALTLSIINRRLHRRDPSQDVLEKVTLIKDIDTSRPHRAHVEILFDLSFERLYQRFGFGNFVELQNAWQRMLDTAELNKRFFGEIANWYFWAIQNVNFPQGAEANRDACNAVSVIRLITRLIFVWFIKEKGLAPDDLFIKRRVDELIEWSDPTHSTYYKAILQNLFFATLNQEMNTPEKPDQRKFRGQRASGRDQHYMVHNVYRYAGYFRDPDAALRVFAPIPFLNGGLFECLDRPAADDPGVILRVDGFSDRPDNELVVPDDLFFSDEREIDLNEVYGTHSKAYTVRGLMNILERYKFTVEENTPIEEEVALDPELLGKVFENLLAAYNPETGVTARKQTGSFYTPREIVGYMVDEALLAYLQEHLTGFEQAKGSHNLSGLEDNLRHLLAYNDEPHRFTPEQVTRLIEAIDALKLLDPACGSGAFPMGALHKLVFILGKLDPRNERWKEAQVAKAAEIPDSVIRDKVMADIEQAFERNELDYGRKLYLIENCIYGVDIQPIAVQIAKLRFFISLIVDQRIDDALPNRGIRPLPNLETKFVAANSLLGIERPAQLMLRNPAIDEKERQLAEVRRQHFTARTLKTKDRYRRLDAELRAEIGELLKRDGFPNETTRKLAYWDPYDQNASADFFDPEWMFGVARGFDVVIGNPPYVRQEQIKELKRPLQKQYECYTGTADLYVYFYERGFNLLREGGLLTYISSNKYFRSAYGEKLRRFLGGHATLHQLVDFGDAPVFEAIAYPCIILARKAQPDANDVRAFTWEAGPPFEDFAAVFQSKSFFIAQSQLAADGWRLESSAVLRLLDRLRHAGQPLGKYVDGRLYRGVVTGLNEAFVVDCATKDRLIAEHESSAELLKPFLRGRDIKRWVVTDPELYLCYVGWETPIKKYPALYEHLAGYEAGLKARPEVQEGRVPWYALSRYAADYWQEFEQPKIILPSIAQSVQYAPDLDGHFSNDKTSICVTDEVSYLLGLLNSQLLWWFIQQTAATKQGGFYEFKPMYVSQLPIAAKAGPTPIIALVDQILAAKRADPTADASAWEREIDQMVYALYGLTQEEIAIVENSA